MIHCEFELTGISDLMFGKHVTEERPKKESHEEFEQRIWNQKVHVTTDGQCYIPGSAISMLFVAAGTWEGEKVPGGGGKATYTRRLKCGLAPDGAILLFKPDGSPMTLDDLECVTLFVPANGKQGNSTRVNRTFPVAREWVAKGAFYLFDEKLTEPVVLQHFKAGGMFVGFGSMRVENGGSNGRFFVTQFDAKEQPDTVGGQKAA